MSTDSRNRMIDGLQTVVVLAGITFGAVPLVQRLVGAEQGFLFRAVAGRLADPAAWLVPLAVVLGVVLVIAVMEKVKR